MDKETAVKLLSTIYKHENMNGYYWEVVELDPQEEANEIIKLIEQQEPYAELGRLAVEANICAFTLDDPCCKKIREEHCPVLGRKGCINYEFCAKRTKLEGVETNV